MRTLEEYSTEKDILPLNKREWNYSFLVGEKVKIIPNMYYGLAISDPISFHYINEELVNQIGVVTKCWEDIHAWGRGSSYMCEVKYGDELITLMAMYFYTSKKFYERNK